MAEQDLSIVAPTQAPSPEGWIDVVLGEFDEFLKDHASCEKKASGMALNVAAHYPDRPLLLGAMVDLAVEELNHYREVIRLLLARSIQPGPDLKDPYVNDLNGLIRRGTEQFLLDRLLVGAVVERRGAERFAIVAAAVQEPELQSFYRAIAASEKRHWHLFVELARHCFADAEVSARLHELNDAEGELVLSLPLRPALH